MQRVPRDILRNVITGRAGVSRVIRGPGLSRHKENDHRCHRGWVQGHSRKEDRSTLEIKGDLLGKLDEPLAPHTRSKSPKESE